MSWKFSESAQRIRLLEMHRRRLARELDVIPESMCTVYNNLEKAFEEAVIAEAKYLADLSKRIPPRL